VFVPSPGRKRRALCGSSLFGLLLILNGCLDRPVGISRPITTNVVIQRQSNDAINSIDLLLLIDNSSSMADKQETLAIAVPQLLNQLVQPQCVDDQGKPFPEAIVATLGASQPCAKGTPEFNPVNDIHIGIVTSSLGDHGGNSRCTAGEDSSFRNADDQPIPQAADVNDKSYLMGKLERGKAALAGDADAGTTSFARVTDQGFLAWGSTSLQTPTPGTSDLEAADAMFRDMVVATNEKGCGFEAQLEGWFRFLIDPVPPVLPLAAPDPKNRSKTSRVGVDDALLEQRAKFLRPDSMVAIVMLTDENDCSLRDTDYGWLVGGGNLIATGSAECATNPNDPCCYSCLSDGPPGKCAWTCPKPPGETQPSGSNDDATQANLRCWRQKERFGVELTYPTSRYSVALTKKELCPDQTFGDMDCDCEYATKIGAACAPGERHLPNPLYSTIVGRKSDGVTDVVGYPNVMPRQDNSAVFLAGIVGVPWQDISEPESQADGVTLKYIPVTDARWSESGGIWDQIVADYNDGKKIPRDPRMIESITPREGLPGPTAGVNADPIIGHEWNTAKWDLEYACIYRRPTAKECKCEPGNERGQCGYDSPNDCCLLGFSTSATQSESFNKPLCQDPQTGSYDARKQYFAKAYPGLRELSVLRDYSLLGEVKGNSIVASICPKDLTSDIHSPGYGYNPAVAALIERLKVHLKGSCLPRPLTVSEDGEVPCNVVEAVPPLLVGGESCATFCEEKHRSSQVSPEMRKQVENSMRQLDLCDGNNGLRCEQVCLCLLPQETRAANKLQSTEYESDLDVCQNADEHTANMLDPGYCYVDPTLLDAEGHPLAGENESLVAKCPSTQRRILRFVGNQPTAEGGSAVPLRGALVFSACQGASIGFQ
jgi:hypothetical protein